MAVFSLSASQNQCCDEWSVLHTTWEKIVHQWKTFFVFIVEETLSFGTRVLRKNQLKLGDIMQASVLYNGFIIQYIDNKTHFEEKITSTSLSFS